jgi:SAM-dependent methyltransferase
MFSILREHLARPPLFSVYSAHTLWTDDHVSSRMLEYHLDPLNDIASRNQAFIQRAATWLAGEFDLVGREVLDLGCGPGLYALELAMLGAKVTGLDFSTRSIDYARGQALAKGLQVEFEVADYLSYETERAFDLICLIYGDYCALGPEQRTELMRRAQRWLKPGGSIVFDVFTRIHLGAVEETTSFTSCPDGGFWSAAPHFVFNTRFKYEDAGAYLDRFLVVEEETEWEVFNWLQCFDPIQLEDELAAAGLRVAQCLGSVAGDPFNEVAQEFAVVAQPANEETV